MRSDLLPGDDVGRRSGTPLYRIGAAGPPLEAPMRILVGAAGSKRGAEHVAIAIVAAAGHPSTLDSTVVLRIFPRCGYPRLTCRRASLDCRSFVSPAVRSCPRPKADAALILARWKSVKQFRRRSQDPCKIRANRRPRILQCLRLIAHLAGSKKPRNGCRH